MKTWLARELDRLHGIRAVVAGMAALVVGGALLLGSGAPAGAPERAAGLGGPARAAAARRVREEALERTLGAVRGIRRASLAVSADGAAVAVAVTPEPGAPLAVEARAAIVRLVCDAFPAVSPRRVTIVEEDALTAAGGQ
jgi:hypothetical protein